jgi:hypothetical protein
MHDSRCRHLDDWSRFLNLSGCRNTARLKTSDGRRSYNQGETSINMHRVLSIVAIMTNS